LLFSNNIYKVFKIFKYICYIILYNNLLNILGNIRFWKSSLLNELISNFLEKTFFLRNYYILNDLIWQDGFLIDFLQKKVIDKWMRKFLIYSAYLFNERLVFDYVVRFYIDLIVWPGHKNTIFEFNNVSSTILITLFLLITIFLFITLFYFSLLIIN
jgi:hypothetical protein